MNSRRCNLFRQISGILKWNCCGDLGTILFTGTDPQFIGKRNRVTLFRCFSEDEAWIGGLMSVLMFQY
jgi:hypothetical protein